MTGQTKHLPGTCSECGGAFEFPAEMIGTTAACPRCGKPIELVLATPVQESRLPRRVIVYTVTGVLILLLGLAGSVWALKRAQAMADRQKQKAAQTVPP